MTARRILHADLDAFYASVEQRDDRRLRARAMAVGGGVVLSASYEARRRGVKTAMSETKARSLCPDLVVVPPRMEAYSEASKAVFEIFADTSPEVEPLSIDEAFIDVTGLWRLSGSDQRIGAALRDRVEAEVGLKLSVGGGSTKFLAKVASAFCKPDGLLIVPVGEELAFLHPLPVGRLWGVGPVAQERLAAVGLETVADVAALDEGVLQDQLGMAWGAHLYALAHNRDLRPVQPGRRRRSVGSQRSFRAGSVDRFGAEQVVVEVADRVARRLRAGDRVGRTITLRLRFADFAAATRSRTLSDPTASTEVILETGRDLLAQAWPVVEARGLTKVGLAVSNLEDRHVTQLSLPFDTEDGRASPSWDEIDGAVDEIRRRFGSAALTRATLVDRQLADVPLLPD